jgi:transcriptional regulator with XRE-family HTH domain
MAAGVLTLPRLFLGEALKRLRAESGRTLDETATAVGKSRARLINVLDGKGTLTAQELERLLDYLDASAELKSELLALGVDARKRPSPRAYTDLLPGSYARLADLESMSTEICSYERGVIPGLLQTPEYIEALMVDGDGIWWESSLQERMNRILFRLERQKLIMEDPSRMLRFVITEDALRTQVGSAETMTQQLEYLLSLVERSNINIRVLSPTVPHNPSPCGGLAVLRLGAQRHGVGMLPVVYGPSTYLDDPVDTHRLSRAFDKIEQLAMDPDASAQLIAQLTKGSSQ